MKHNFYKNLFFNLGSHVPEKTLFFKGNEYWLPVNKTEKLYYVSSFGKVKSYRRSVVGDILKLAVTTDKYLMTYLYIKNSSRLSISIHRLVALHFLDNTENKPQVNHLDGDKFNNRVCNLEWATSQENIHHAIKTGLRTADINLRIQDKFSERDILDIRNLIELGLGNQDICKIYNCVHSTISKIRRGHHYPSEQSSIYDKWNDLGRKNKILFDTETGLFYENLKQAADAKSINHQVLRYQILYSVNKKTSICYV